MNGLKIWDTNWAVKTAGPSPYNNERTELFLLGCKKAMSGNPCKGCFNNKTWDDSIAEFTHDPIEVAKTINNFAPNKYVTIGGGEPTDQIDNLIVLCHELKKYGFHIMVYTWRSLLSEMKQDTEFKLKMLDLFQTVDMIIDGEYQQDKRLYQEKLQDGTFNSVGSGNQIVWSHFNGDLVGFVLEDLHRVYLNEFNDLCYKTKDNAKQYTITIGDEKIG